MRPMSEMRVVTVDVTTRCFKQCSGCTRLVGHVPVRDMDLDTFRAAVDSLEGHPGLIGVIGGEPLLWPHLEAATDYLVERTGGPDEVASSSRLALLAKPVSRLTDFLIANYGDVKVKRGIFTSLPPSTIRHWEKILDSYQYVGFNTHENAGLHQQILVAGGELPVSEKVRYEMIQDCWVNKFWSCGITPQGCWPCEVMGSLAHAFDGPGPKQGWPIEKDWWRRPPEDWGDMLKWCEICGAAMDVPRLPSTSDREIVSPANYERLRGIGSRKVARGVVEVMDVASYDAVKYKATKHLEWYLPSAAEGVADKTTRIGSTANNLRPRKLECVMVCVGYSDLLALTLPWNVRHWDTVVVVTGPDDAQTAEVAARHGARVVVSDSYLLRGARFNKGAMLNAGVAALDYDGWAMFVDADILLPPNFRETFARHVWNPGVLYYATRLHTPSASPLKWVAEYKKNPALARSLPVVNSASNRMPWGYCQLFHPAARALRGLGRNIYSDAFSTAAGVDNHFAKQWPDHKRHLTDFRVIHIDHGTETVNWSGRQSAPLGAEPLTGVIASDGWIPVGWLDERGYNPVFPIAPGGFLKLIRCDTGESVVVANDRSAGLLPDSAFGADASGVGTITGGSASRAEHAYHWGIVAPRHRIEGPCAGGRVVVRERGSESYSGWGLGHVLPDADRQGYAWDGAAIGATKFEVFRKTTLSPDDVSVLS